MTFLMTAFVVAVWVVALGAVIWFGISRLHEDRLPDSEIQYLERQRRTDIGERW